MKVQGSGFKVQGCGSALFVQADSSKLKAESSKFVDKINLSGTECRLRVAQHPVPDALSFLPFTFSLFPFT